MGSCGPWRPEVRYLLGVLAGILSGIVFTASSILQKRAINAIGDTAPFFLNLARSPLWLLGFALSFAIGAPLSMASYMAIGPTIPPALGSLGLAAVPVLARLFLGERPAALSYAGAAAVALAVACIGLSGMAIAPEGINWLDPGFLLRAAAAFGSVLLVAAACLGSGLLPRGAGAMPLALAAGAFQAVANALMAPIAGQLGLLVSGNLGLAGFLIAGLASIALASVNLGAIAVAQLALRKGTAAMVVPIQQLPIQLTPLVFHAVLYRGGFGAAGKAALLGSGLVLLIAGSFALGRGKAKAKALGKLPAAAACLVLAFAGASPTSLGAQDASPAGSSSRYAFVDEAGHVTGTLDITVAKGSEGMEISSIDSAGFRGYARLGEGMVQEEVRYDIAPGQAIRFTATERRESWTMEGGARGLQSRTERTWLGDRSIFFVLPTLVDPGKTGDEARFVLVRPDGLQRATMRLRAEGAVDLGLLGGKVVRAYRISMELADPVGRMFWPYTYNYYYRVGDRRFLAYDGPDDRKRTSRIAFVGDR